MTIKHFSFLSLLFFINNNAMLPWEDPDFKNQENKINSRIISKTEKQPLNIYSEIDNQNKKCAINHKVEFELNQPVPDYLKKFTVSPMIDSQNKQGDTPLHNAIMKYGTGGGNAKTIIQLLTTGHANPFIENNNKRTPRQEAELIQKEKNITELANMIDVLKLCEEAYYINFAEIAQEKINSNNQ